MKTRTPSALFGARGVFCALVGCLLAGASLLARAQEPSLRAERTVAYRAGKAAELKARVGPVVIESVEFRDLGRGSGGGGLADRLRGGASGSEASTTIRSHFLAQSPSPDEWEVTFTLEFLDASGKLIDRVTRRSSWEGEAKPYDLDHPLLEYVVPLVAQVRIKLEGRLD